MRIVTFGELMLRLSPEGYYRFFQNDRLQTSFGGAEANVAVSLALFGADSVYVTKFPQHAIGQAAVDSLRQMGVDTTKIVRGGNRVGVFYLEKGAPGRTSVCIYDRAHSAIAEAEPSDFNWDEILDGADWFHLTGITLGLGGRLPEICLQACQAAKRKGVKVSFDPNYRAKLWTMEEAAATMQRVFPYVDLFITNENQAQELFGVEIPAGERSGDDVTDAGYRALCESLCERYGFSQVALSERRTYTTDENRICGKFYDGKSFYTSPQYRVRIVDRVGGGDALDAGLIFSLLRGDSAQDAINFAVASSALKHSIECDYNRVTLDEVEALAKGKANGRVQR